MTTKSGVIFVICGSLASALVAAPVSPTDRQLSMAQAMEMAIKNNVDVQLARAGTEQARAKALKDASDLLPQLNGTVSQARVFKVNLAAQGLGDFPGINPLLGPFNVFDARVTLVQNIFDLSSVWSAKAGRKRIIVGRLEENLAREQVASAAALAYVDLVREQQSVDAAQVDFNLARSLFELSKDQRHAGLATGVDVTRAQTRMVEGNLRLINARKGARQASLRLARVVGLPFDQRIIPSDSIEATTTTAADFTEAALNEAQKARAEIGIANELVEAMKDSLASYRADNAPVLKAMGDYGASGNSANNSKGTGSISARVELPILNGGKTTADIRSAKADLESAELRRDDMRRRVEEDVRLAFDTLAADREAVDAASQAFSLAEKEMQMARDRYASGVGDNIQVITAQNVLAQAQDDRINALATYTAARINLEMAMGRAQSFKLNP